MGSSRVTSQYRTLDDYGGAMDEFYDWCQKHGYNYRRSILVGLRLFKWFARLRK